MNGQGGAGDSPSTIVSTTFDPDFLASSLKTRLGVRPGNRVCVAYSGGMDSHVLLHALAKLRGEFPFKLRAVHIDHGLQPGSHRWSDHCAGVCEQLAVELVTHQLHLKPELGASIEAAARSARYAALSEVVHEGEYCLTAQHADDQAETILLQLLRGAGMHGLAGMPDVTDFGAGKLGRPLLGVTRSALAAYAAEQRLDWSDDPSNRDSRFDRNYLRNTVMPLIHERWPSATASLVRSAGHAAAAARMLEEQGRCDLADVCAHDLGDSDDCLACLDIRLLGNLPRERQANALRCWIRRFPVKLPSHARLNAALETLVQFNNTGSGKVQWPGSLLRRDGDLLYLCREAEASLEGFDSPVTWDPACLLKLPGRDYVLEAVAVAGQGCSLDKIQGRKLKVEMRHGGETCRMTADFGRKPLRKVFQDLGVPRWQRDGVPLVYLDGELIAIGHYWLDPHLAPDSDSKGLVFVTRRAHVSIENRRAL